MASNLYLHFPFCRRKCAYCALPSRAGATAAERRSYAERLAAEIAALPGAERFDTVYCGGGSPTLCDLRPVFAAVGPRLNDGCEFTVELHPLDVSPAALDALRRGGVNRVSMGVQSLDDAVLRDMGRGYDADTAERAFATVRRSFDNAGIDLIAGYPGSRLVDSPRWRRLADWGLAHCSVYSLILEDRTSLAKRVRGGLRLPDDDEALDEIREVAATLAALGLFRYEISNYARPGRECRHNLATWRGEDYRGLGEGAAGRLGLKRTLGRRDGDYDIESVSPERDRVERAIFRLRTRDGLDAAAFPEWRERLDRFAAEGALVRRGDVYALTDRGTEICDAILAELV